jgi:hypothetical protein
LFEICGCRRVTVVCSSQILIDSLDSEPSPAVAMRAIEFLDELLERLPV